VIVQVPAATIVTVVPETVQTLVVELVKLTVVPAESVTEARENVPAPPGTQFSLAGMVQVNVWFVGFIVILTGVPGVLA
jgi:hypothetical protein